MTKSSLMVGIRNVFQKDGTAEVTRSDTVSLDKTDDYFHKIEAIKKWDDRLTFILYTVAYTIGLGNVWKFPYKVYINGRGSFLFVFTVVCLCLGVPLLTLEFGVGQFTGRACTNAFRMVPLFSGIGWSMLILSALISIYYAVITCWAYFYMFSTLAKSLPWSHCNGDYNSFSCVPSHYPGLNENGSGVSSAKEFFQHYIIRLKSPETNNHPLSAIAELANVALILSMAVVFFLPVVINIFGKRITGRILHFTVVYPYCILFAFLLRSILLAGSVDGLLFYITPSWKYFLNVQTYLDAIEQIFFSLGLGMGVMINLSRYNDFNANFVLNAAIIVLVNYLSCLFFGFIIFVTLGCFSAYFGVILDDSMKAEWEFFFVAYPTVFCQLFGEVAWNFVFMFMLVCVGFDAQMVFMQCMTTSIHESFPRFKNQFMSNFILELGIALALFMATIFLLGPGGVHWMKIVLEPVISSLVAILIFLEIVAVTWIYGYVMLSRDYKMMLKIDVFKRWIFLLSIAVPPLLILFVVGNAVNFNKYRIDEVGYPWWAEVITVLLVVIALFPILVVMVDVLTYYKKELPHLNMGDIVKQTLRPYSDWGPFHKRDWLQSTRYKSKLTYRLDNSVMKLSLTESGNFNEILRESQF